MKVGIDYGLAHLDIDVASADWMGGQAPSRPEPLADPVVAARDALEHPLDFPPLRRALTPDDHIAIIVDERLPRLADVLAVVIDHVLEAGVSSEDISLLCPSPSSGQPWLDDMADEYQEVRVEVHNPNDRRCLSYLATTQSGRRIYLNRTAVDADQLIVVTRSGYDPLLGYGGAAGAIFPTLSDQATRRDYANMLSFDVPGARPWPARQEAQEVAWLLGAPFFLHFVEGRGADLLHVSAGLLETGDESRRWLDACWRVSVPCRADTVIASVGGDPARNDFADLARALACAARVVQPQGRIVLLSQVVPELGAGAELLRQADSVPQALELLLQRQPDDLAAAFLWASAARHASVYLLSGLPPDTAEELFTIPLDHAGQLKRLLEQEGTYLYLADAHKTMAEVKG
ncbi:MAG: lactate racemase domain-containing protein [Gemmataceae bacterium]